MLYNGVVWCGVDEDQVQFTRGALLTSKWWCSKGSPKKQIGNHKWLDGHQGDKHFEGALLNGLKLRKRERVTNVGIIIDINLSMLALLCSRVLLVQERGFGGWVRVALSQGGGGDICIVPLTLVVATFRGFMFHPCVWFKKKKSFHIMDSICLFWFEWLVW